MTFRDGCGCISSFSGVLHVGTLSEHMKMTSPPRVRLGKFTRPLARHTAEAPVSGTLNPEASERIPAAAASSVFDPNPHCGALRSTGVLRAPSKSMPMHSLEKGSLQVTRTASFVCSYEVRNFTIHCQSHAARLQHRKAAASC